MSIWCIPLSIVDVRPPHQPSSLGDYSYYLVLLQQLRNADRQNFATNNGRPGWVPSKATIRHYIERIVVESFLPNAAEVSPSRIVEFVLPARTVTFPSGVTCSKAPPGSCAIYALPSLSRAKSSLSPVLLQPRMALLLYPRD